VASGRDSAIRLISSRWASVNLGGRPPRYRGYNDSNPSALKLWITSRTRSWLVNVTRAICGTSIAWAESSTICARRHVTTEPVPRRRIRNSRLPSSLLIGLTWTRSATETPHDKLSPGGFAIPDHDPCQQQGKRCWLRH
jgi:hypothetical protein